MGRSKGNLKKGNPPRVGNPPSKTRNPEWWKDVENLMRLHPLYPDRRNYEKKQQKKQ